MRAFAITAVLMLTVGGCQHWTKQDTQAAVAVSGDVLECSVDNYAVVEHAITLGGNAGIGDWLSAIVGLFQCIPAVVKHIEAAQAVAMLQDPTEYMLAATDNDEIKAPLLASPPVKVLSKTGRRRLAAAKVLGDVLNQNVVRK